MAWLCIALALWSAVQLPLAVLIGRAIARMAGEYFDHVESDPQ